MKKFLLIICLSYTSLFGQSICVFSSVQNSPEDIYRNVLYDADSIESELFRKDISLENFEKQLYSKLQNINPDFSNDRPSVNNFNYTVYDFKSDKILFSTSELLMYYEKKYPDLNKIKPVAPKLIDKSKGQFLILYDRTKIPELNAFNKLLFEESGVSFDLKKMNDRWEKIEIIRIDSSEIFELKFIRFNIKYSVTATPVTEEKDFEKSLSNYNKEEAKYDSIVNLIANERESAKRKSEEKIIKFKKDTNESEKRLKEDEKFKEDHKIEIQQIDTIIKAFRASGYANPGTIWLKRTQKVKVKFIDSLTNDEIKFYPFYLVDKTSKTDNLVYEDDLSFDPSNENFIWAYTKDLLFAYINPTQFSTNVKDKKEVVFKVMLFKPGFVSVAQAQSFLGLTETKK